MRNSEPLAVYLSKKHRFPTDTEIRVFSDALWADPPASSSEGPELSQEGRAFVLDVSALSDTWRFSGIPRLVQELALKSGHFGWKTAIWAQGRLCPVEVSSSGKLDYPSAHWRLSLLWRIYSAVSGKVVSIIPRNPFLLTVIGIASPILRTIVRLIPRPRPRTNMDISDTTILIPHIPAEQDLSRLRVAKDGMPGLRIRVLLHDVLPITHPHFFSRERVASHVRLGQLLPKAEVIHVGSEQLAVKVSDWIQFLTEGEIDSEIRIDSFPSMVASPPGKPINSDKTKLVFIGGFQARKGLRELADAVQSGKLPSYKFEVVGSPNPFLPDENSLVKRIRGLKAFDLKGQVSDSELAILLSEARVVLYLSTAEGFGLPIVEAARFGCSVVAADTQINRELSERVPNLFLVPLIGEEIDTEQIGATLQRALSKTKRVNEQTKPDNGSEHGWAEKILSVPNGVVR